MVGEGESRFYMDFWTANYQELERKPVSGYGGRKELYQFGLGAFVQALIETVNKDLAAAKARLSDLISTLTWQ